MHADATEGERSLQDDIREQLAGSDQDSSWVSKGL